MIRHRCLLPLAAVLATLGATLVAAPAGAATYTVNVCALSDFKTNASQNFWRTVRHDGDTSTSTNGCPTAGERLQLNPGITHSISEYLDYTFTVPADLKIAGYRLWRSARVGGDAGYRSAIWEFAGAVRQTFDDCRDSCRTLGTPGTPGAANNLVSRKPAVPLDSLTLHTSCAITTTCAARSPAVDYTLHRAELDLDDAQVPQLLSPPTGPLVEAGRTLAGAVPVTINASDRGSGVKDLAVEVDGKVLQRTVLDANGGACKPPFKNPVPCKLSVSATVPVDTSKLTDGAHQLRLLVYDATGKNAAVWGPATITTSNSSCSPDPAVSPAPVNLGAWLQTSATGRAHNALTVPFGRQVRLSGRLLDPAGAPVVNAPLCLASQIDAPGAGAAGSGSLTTGPDGRFSVLLPPGPSRTVWVVQRVSGGAVAARVLVRQRAGVSFHFRRSRLSNGGLLGMFGKVQGPIPAGGVLVSIQARRSTGWQTFKEARTGSNGIFRGRYRFTRVSGTTRFVMRAIVHRQAGFPYSSGAADPIGVIVRSG